MTETAEGVHVLPHIDDVYPLTGPQSGILFHALQRPDSTLGFEQLEIDVEGDLDVEALQRALDDVVRRHPILRTHLLWDGVPEPVQVVRNDVSVVIEVDYRRDDPPDDAELTAMAAAERAIPFDLARPPLVRVRLVRRSERSARIIWNAHHVLLDGWSTPRLLAGWFERYDQHVGGHPAPATPATPFRDYIAWLQHHDTDGDDRYWADAVRSAPPATLPLPPETGPGDRGRVDLTIDAESTDRLKTVCRNHRVTLGSAFLTGWSLVLADLLGRADFSFATTASGRPPELAGVEEIAGMLIANQPVVCHLDPDQTLRDALQATQRRQHEMLEHPTIDPGAVTSLADIPDLDFDHLVVVQGAPTPPEPGRLDWSVAGSYDESRYAIDVFVTPGPEIEIALLHDRTRVTDAVATGLAERFAVAVRRLAEAPDDTVDTTITLLASHRPSEPDRTPLTGLLADAAVTGTVLSGPLAAPLLAAFETIDGVELTTIPGEAAADPSRVVRAALRTRATWLVTSAATLDATIDAFPDLARRLAGLEGWLTVDPIDDATVTAATSALPHVTLAALDDADHPTALTTSPGAHAIGRLADTAGPPDPATTRVLDDGTVVRTTARPTPSADDAPADRPVDDDLIGAVIDIWRDRLDLDSIGPDDDFFSIGGTSLTAVGMLAAVADRLGAEVPVGSLVDARTPRALADRINAGAERPTDSTYLVLLRDGADTEAPVVFIHGAGGNIVNFARMVEHVDTNAPLYGIEAAGVDGIQLPHRTFDELVETYDDEITRVVGTDDVTLAGYSGGGVIAHALAARREARGRPVQRLVLIDTFHPDVVFDGGEHRASDRLSFAHIRNRLRDTIRESRTSRALDVALRSVEHDWAIVPLHVREAHVERALGALFAGYATPSYTGPTRLVWTTEDFAGKATAAARGWDPHLPQLETVPTGGDHLTLFDDDWLAATAASVQLAVSD